MPPRAQELCSSWRIWAKFPNVVNVSKRWAAWPQRAQRLINGIAIVVAAIAIGWALLVPLADWLAHSDVGSVGGSLLQTARDAAQGRLLTLAAGSFAAGALWFTARNVNLYRETQVTDRYTRAIDQLGSSLEKLDVRLGGIYSLERIARDSARDHSTVMEVLTAFIREHSSEQWPLPDRPPSRRPINPEQERRSTRPDIQAALAVIGRRDSKRDLQPIDLAYTDLPGVRLTSPDFACANLTDANLIGADLTGANLTKAYLTDANLIGGTLVGASLVDAKGSGASLVEADLTRADLTRADLNEAYLTASDLTRANLTDANLTGAELLGTNLTHANLPRANLAGAYLTGGGYGTVKGFRSTEESSGANFTNANLTNADFTDARIIHSEDPRPTFTGAKLTGVIWPRDVPAPEGWELDVGSGRLKARTVSGPADAN